MNAHEIITAIARLPEVEQIALSEVMAARATGGKTSAAQVDNALASIAGMNGNMRRAVIEALIAKGVVGGDVDSLSASAGSVKTPNAILAASQEHGPLLRQLRAELARIGYDLEPDRPVNVFKLNEAIKASGNIQRGWYLKSALAQCGLLH